MCAVHSGVQGYDGRVKMAESLAVSAGFGSVCIGILDCSNRRLADVWIGREDPSGMTETEAVEQLSRTLMVSVALNQIAPMGAGNDSRPAPASGTRPIWLRNPCHLIGIGEPVGKLAPFVAFLRHAPDGMASREQEGLARIGLTYAEQLLHDQHGTAAEESPAGIPEVILRSLSFGFAVADAQGMLGYATDRSWDWLGRSQELHVVNGRLMAMTPHNQQLLQNALANATSGAARSAVVQFDGVDGLPKTVVVLPLGTRPPLALVVFGQEQSDVSLREQLLETLGLTVAERRLAQHLLAGKSLADAAEDSNLTIATARSYLKRIFAKTGIHRQSQLITLYHSLIPPLHADLLPESRRRGGGSGAV